MRARDWYRQLLRAVHQRSRKTAGGPRPPGNSSEPAQEVVLQQLTRVRTPDGHEAIRATLRAEFAEGQREASLYIGFCPPFERLPNVTASADDDLAEAKVVQLLHNGAQLEVRLTEPAEQPLAVAITVDATATTTGGTP